MGFPRQEYWSGLPFPPPGDLLDPGIKPESPASLALVARFFTPEPPRKPLITIAATITECSVPGTMLCTVHRFCILHQDSPSVTGPVIGSISLRGAVKLRGDSFLLQAGEPANSLLTTIYWVAPTCQVLCMRVSWNFHSNLFHRWRDRGWSSKRIHNWLTCKWQNWDSVLVWL